MGVPHPLRRFLLTVAFVTVAAGGSWTLLKTNQRTREFKSRELYPTIAGKTLVGYLADCLARADADERAAEALQAKRSTSAEEESQIRILVENARWWRENKAATSKLLDYHTALARKYALASRSPWKPVPPDPPAPPRWNGRPSPPPEEEPLDEELAGFRRKLLESARKYRENKRSSAETTAVK